MARNALEILQMSLQFDQYHKKDRHDGRVTEKFPRFAPPPPPDGCQLFKDPPHKLPISGKWPSSQQNCPPPPHPFQS